MRSDIRTIWLRQGVPKGLAGGEEACMSLEFARAWVIASSKQRTVGTDIGALVFQAIGARQPLIAFDLASAVTEVGEKPRLVCVRRPLPSTFGTRTEAPAAPELDVVVGWHVVGFRVRRV